jgi:hypothetical protein
MVHFDYPFGLDLIAGLLMTNTFRVSAGGGYFAP